MLGILSIICVLHSSIRNPIGNMCTSWTLHTSITNPVYNLCTLWILHKSIIYPVHNLCTSWAPDKSITNPVHIFYVIAVRVKIWSRIWTHFSVSVLNIKHYFFFKKNSSFILLLLSSHVKQPICVYGFIQFCNIWTAFLSPVWFCYAQTSQCSCTSILPSWWNEHCWLDFLYLWIYPVFIVFTHKKAHAVTLWAVSRHL